MKKNIRKTLIYLAVFVSAFFLMLGFLILSASVKKEAVQENFEESAEYLCEKKEFFYMEKNVESSWIDRYADSILLNIAYSFDTDDPARSAMWSSYYNDPEQNENLNLSDAVNSGKEKNMQYLRYWHGSAGVVKLFHTFMNIKGIYIFHGILMFILTVLIVILLIRYKLGLEAVLVVLSMVAVSIWYVPLSLEYTWVFLCMLTVSIIVIVMVQKKKYAGLGIVFMLSGMVTIFLDFLTTETLTLTIPLIFYLIVKKRGQGIQVTLKVKEELKFMAKNACMWGIGYIGMWTLKWITASVVLGENVMPYVTEHIEERISGEIGDISLIEYLWRAIYRNVGCLFPMGYGVTGVIIAGILLLVILYICFVYRKKKIEWGNILLLTIIGLVPYARFLVVRNHSTLHYFFVFRALMASVLAFLISAKEIIDTNFFRKKEHENLKKRSQ